MRGKAYRRDGACCNECNGPIIERKTGVANKEPLLTITVQDLDSIPVITYKGEDIQGRASLSYEWVTRDNKGEGKHDMSIKHYPNTTGTPVLKTIALSRLM
ncbi:hypothetical protein J2T13_000862 [Paenibacillus sp. DS2015]|uniref:hypothetical protein n=1 Tax=Paenibacillus sp. DS2015 TaxID=3373917 RepID=UPI003D250401